MNADVFRWQSVRETQALASSSAGRPRRIAISIAVAFLVASLVRFLVFVFCEVPLLGVVPVMRMVILTLPHTLLVPFVVRIVPVFVFRILVVVLDGSVASF
jgi:hypothetical protein